MHEKKNGQTLKNWNFSVSIDWMPIESSRFKPKFLNTISISRVIGSIDWKSGKHNFWKTEQFYAETPQSIVFYE